MKATNENSGSLLELHQVSKTFESGPAEVSVLTDIDFSVTSGETVAIVGPSGCGKSTLLNLIGTLEKPTSGSIAFDGQDILQLNANQLAEFRNQSIGFIFQLHHLLPQCSVLENVLIPTLVNKNRSGARQRAEALLDRVGLSDRVAHLPGELSGGERQRVAVVRALVNRPRLLLADEPTGSLSSDGAEQLTALLLELNKEENLALIVVTHSMSVASSMGRVLELDHGTLSTYAEKN
ncbi:MAG: ABC transporter [Candidatus Hydrogenedentota bacterium]|nr:MAG: ABC transporter [Candidatus Hydrogenedentota bacterium]